MAQRRRGHEDDLENPEADVRDGEGPVVADVLATGLFGVTDETRLFVAPHALRPSSQDHDAKQEQHAHPDLPDDRGVRLDLIQQSRQKAPVSHLCCCCSDTGKRKKYKHTTCYYVLSKTIM
uniref:Uncharacterized protein n=1 Tax=Neogobius melanostomus TaxID=47308 RepID=A0A8C6ULQ4_9GOBI